MLAKRSIKLVNLDAFAAAFSGAMFMFVIAFIELSLLFRNSGLGNTTALLITTFGGFVPSVSIFGLSVMSLFTDVNYKLIGGAICLLSFLSWIGTSGGLLIGFLLAITGGMMIYLRKNPQKTNILGNETKTLNQ